MMAEKRGISSRPRVRAIARSRGIRAVLARVRRHRHRTLVSVAAHALTCPGARALVEPGMALPASLDANALRLGNNPYDPRVTYLADLRDPGALSAGRFQVLILDGAFARVDRDRAVRNTFEALTPAGVLVVARRPGLRRSLSARFATVDSRWAGYQRVLVARTTA